MKTKRLICPKCGNVEKFNIDVEITVASAPLIFNGKIAEVDIAFPNDCDLMDAFCGVCGADIRAVWHDAIPHVMCPHCQLYVKGIIVESCSYGSKKNSPNDYPACFRWKNGEDIELELIT